jgi:hypothetical protein
MSDRPVGRPTKAGRLLELDLQEVLSKADPTIISGCWLDFRDPRREAVWIAAPDLPEQAAEPSPTEKLMKSASSPRQKAAALLSYANRTRLKKFS